MLKKDITYENFNGETLTETFYFNLTKPELVELEVEFKDGFSELLKNIVETQDAKILVREFKRIILLSYGVRSEDGKRFIKNDELREEFSQTGAYDALFMEFVMDADKGADFIKGILPKDLASAVEAANVELPAVPEVEETKTEAS